MAVSFASGEGECEFTPGVSVFVCVDDDYAVDDMLSGFISERFHGDLVDVRVREAVGVARDVGAMYDGDAHARMDLEARNTRLHHTHQRPATPKRRNSRIKKGPFFYPWRL